LIPSQYAESIYGKLNCKENLYIYASDELKEEETVSLVRKKSVGILANDIKN